MGKKPRILFFTSEGKGAGEGLRNLVESSLTPTPDLDGEVVGIISNKRGGEVQEVAKQLNIPFECFDGTYNAAGYRWLAEYFKADFVVLYGWLQLVAGLETPRTVNSHPALLPMFGGPGMYRRHVHEAVLAAFRRGEIKCSGFTVHFADERFDHGPIIYQSEVPIFRHDTPETLAARIGAKEQWLLPFILNLVVHGQIECLPDEQGGWRTHYRNPYLKKILTHKAGNNG